MSLPHVAALLAAIDAGDDGALPILADALEEADDPLVAGARLIGDARPWAGHEVFAWLRWIPSPNSCPSGGFVSQHVFDRLRGQKRRTANYVYYHTRSAAYLALARTLMETP
jgi:hypothetical protein